MSRILIIEDEESIASLEKDYLELSGFEVDIETDGNKGLDKALNRDYDLFILDLMLPGMDGFDICREIRERLDTPILMVSAKKDDIDKIRGLGLGADDYITKPFSPSELVARTRPRGACGSTGKRRSSRRRSSTCSPSWRRIRTMCTRRTSCSVKSGTWSQSVTSRP